MPADEIGLGLAQAIKEIRAELLKAQTDQHGPAMRLPVEGVTIELQVVATREIGGKAGIRVPFVDLELGLQNERSHENTSKVTVVLGRPVDIHGNPVAVSGRSSTPRV